MSTPSSDVAVRVLVLGSTLGSRLVTSHAWDRLPRDLNVADFDHVILDFTPFDDAALAEAIAIETLPHYRQFARLLFSEGSEIIGIGNPDLRLGDNPYLPVTWWLPGFPDVVRESGVSIRDVDDSYQFYFRHVRSYRFHVGQDVLKSWSALDFVTTAIPNAVDLGAESMPLAQTRFHQAVGCILIFLAYGPRDRAREPKVSRISSPAIWLPPPTDISSVEAIELILAERYGIRAARETPKWALAIDLPREEPIKKQIDHLERRIRETETKLASAREDLEAESRFRKLLFEKGEEILEPVARDALAGLGANVSDPIERGRDDGRLTDPFGREAILEIKGRTGTLKLADVRELHQWVGDALVEEGRQLKGILVINAHADTTPAERPNPYPPNAASAAQRAGICLVTTVQLLSALRQHQKGQLNLQGFWDEVFMSQGPCGLPESLS